ncbi:HtaA domain-containing protein [uncultured Serinicoccus sp.]|uniref:HtaA domain-containing protein n=1 Tax=uncultured Serinicoccus sp. TaxID=735514 RepID=UPI00261345C8|nr:HtaA domain-containing protein [uncultured Serinicoccus sp.]
MTRLVWGVKASLLSYVRGMPDGRVLLDGVEQHDAGFAFAPDVEADLLDRSVQHFQGSVTLLGHHGMMRVVLADPWIHPAPPGAVLTLADPEAADGRLRFALIARFDGAAASGTTLTAEGAELFYGPYVEGTDLDDPRTVP